MNKPFENITESQTIIIKQKNSRQRSHAPIQNQYYSDAEPITFFPIYTYLHNNCEKKNRKQN